MSWVTLKRSRSTTPAARYGIADRGSTCRSPSTCAVCTAAPSTAVSIRTACVPPARSVTCTLSPVMRVTVCVPPAAAAGEVPDAAGGAPPPAAGSATAGSAAMPTPATPIARPLMAAAIERRRRRADDVLFGMGEPLAVLLACKHAATRAWLGWWRRVDMAATRHWPVDGGTLVLEAIGLDDEHTAVYRLLLSTPSADDRRDRPRRVDVGAPRAGGRRRARAARPARPTGVRTRSRGRVAAVARAAADAARARAPADRGARDARRSSASSTARARCGARCPTSIDVVLGPDAVVQRLGQLQAAARATRRRLRASRGRPRRRQREHRGGPGARPRRRLSGRRRGGAWSNARDSSNRRAR